MYKLCFFVPGTHLEKVKDAVFLTGAGRIGLYENCSWQTLGTGQFRSMSGSDPFIGGVGELTSLDEFKVELVCSNEVVHEAVKALKQSHPYEEPAYEVMLLEEI